MAGTEPGTDAGVWKTDERPRRDGDAGRKARKVQRRTDRGQVIASPSAIEDLWDRRGRPCGRGCWVAGRGGHKKEGASCLKTSRRRNGSIALPPGSAVGIHTRCHGVLLRIPARSSSCPATACVRHRRRIWPSALPPSSHASGLMSLPNHSPSFSHAPSRPKSPCASHIPVAIFRAPSARTRPTGRA